MIRDHFAGVGKPILRLFRPSDRNWRDRKFAPILSHTLATDGPGELLLTREHMLAHIDMRLEARRLFRADRQASARKGVETKRRKGALCG